MGVYLRLGLCIYGVITPLALLGGGGVCSNKITCFSLLY